MLHQYWAEKLFGLKMQNKRKKENKKQILELIQLGAAS